MVRQETYGFKGTLDPLNFLKDLGQQIQYGDQSLIKSSSKLTSNEGLNQSVSYTAIKREVNNIFVPFAA